MMDALTLCRLSVKGPMSEALYAKSHLVIYSGYMEMMKT